MAGRHQNESVITGKGLTFQYIIMKRFKLLASAAGDPLYRNRIVLCSSRQFQPSTTPAEHRLDTVLVNWENLILPFTSC